VPDGRGTIFKFEWNKRNPHAPNAESQPCHAANQ
jgi:hypothetical protein